MKIVLLSNVKKHKGSLIGIFLLMLFLSTAFGTVLTVWANSSAYIIEQMQRSGFGDLTAWVSGVPDMSKLADYIESLEEVEAVEVQSVIFSNYTVYNQESDSEGQLIVYKPEEKRYRFFTQDLSDYKERPSKIGKKEVYVSPSMISIFNIQIGDEIVFPLARAGNNMIFTVKGFYEDPFMGSSMIGMKGFLISEEDYYTACNILQNAGIDALARDGGMFHIFSKTNSITTSELNRIINEHTALAQYTEFVHSKEAIAGFMVILQNAFGGLLAAFTFVLLIVVLVAISYSIRSTMETDMVNMGILKTIGLTSIQIRKVQLMQYSIPIIGGMILGIFFSIPFSAFICNMTLTTTGMCIPIFLPIVWMIFCFGIILILLMGFIVLRTRKISKIKPIQAIFDTMPKMSINMQKKIGAFGKRIYLRLAVRQLSTGKRCYISALTVAIVLVFFASLIGRIDAWLGADGKGMMDAFNPADHDIGVQVFGTLDNAQAEAMIRSYSDITDMYLLAMPSVAVNGVDYTANVIDQPERFHMLKGKTCINDNEIVLTEFVAADFGVAIGDVVTVQGERGSSEYRVSGIYSCANDMGNNVGMSREGYLKIAEDNPHIWCWHYFLADLSQKKAITEALENAYGGDVHVHENTWSGLFGIIYAMRMLVVFMYIMVAVFILIVTVMTGSKILVIEQKDLGIYKAIGFSTNHLRASFALRFGMIAVLGSIIGIILAAILTNPIVSFVMKLAGISNFASFATIENVLLPVSAVTILFLFFAYLAAGKIKKINLIKLIRE